MSIRNALVIEPLTSSRSTAKRASAGAVTVAERVTHEPVVAALAMLVVEISAPALSSQTILGCSVGVPAEARTGMST